MTLFSRFRSRYGLLLGMICLGAFFVGFGVLASIWLSTRDWEQVEVIPGEVIEAESTSAMLMVDISGAVDKPGIYSLPFGSRIADALSLAGGLSASADRQWVSKYINLSQKISDEFKLYIPELSVSHTDSSSASLSSSLPDVWMVQINSAPIDKLESLPGIGKVRAQAIISGRPYFRTEELVERRILPESIFDKISDRLVL